MKILIAEDDPLYRHLIQTTLAEWGYEVVTAEEGEAAWRILQGADTPKIAILDWMMPGLDGLEVCRRVRALERPEPTYIILLTSRGGKENTISALEGGADDYVTKPFDRAELHARLQAGRRIVGLQASLAARVRELEGALSGAAKMEAIGRLAGGVAHDFNNLLTVINGYGEVLIQQIPSEDPRHGLIQQICEAGDRAACLTRQLLAFGHKQVLSPVVLDVNSVVTEFEKMLRRLIGEDIRLSLVLAPDLDAVRADRGQIEQVIMNLVVNARDAMPQGGNLTLVTRPVAVQEGRPSTDPNLPPGNYVLLAVSDTGCGMDEATQARIFEPFFTTKEVGKGTGLGLATVYGIVKQSGGHIGVSSQQGRGTTFRIYLPSVGSRLQESIPSPDLVIAQGHGETILLVEDEEGVRNLAMKTLTSSGYKVLAAGDGNEALRIAGGHAGPIDLLATDMIMPYLNGPQLAAQLRQARPGLNVLYMSGYASDTLGPQRALESGIVFLQKPFTPRVLTRKVQQALRSKG
ncbi:MAG: response regulator [Gemmataceae bacterium]|nr:response regulator [Gemmataceae bacterium]